MGYLMTAGIMIYIGLVVIGLYVIAPQHVKADIQDFLQNI
jgi:hypothetical protein